MVKENLIKWTGVVFGLALILGSLFYLATMVWPTTDQELTDAQALIEAHQETGRPITRESIEESGYDFGWFDGRVFIVFAGLITGIIITGVFWDFDSRPVVGKRKKNFFLMQTYDEKPLSHRP
jgi:hypothetical protein